MDRKIKKLTNEELKNFLNELTSTELLLLSVEAKNLEINMRQQLFYNLALKAGKLKNDKSKK